MKFWSRALLLLALPLAAVACSDGDEGEQDIAHDVTVDDLAAMVLTKERLGEKFALGLQFAEESGPQPNDKFLENFEDASEGRRFVEEFGRVTGYDQGFQGPALVAQSLALYGTADGADAAVGALLDESNGERGVEREEFDAGPVGDESHAAIVRQVDGGLSAVVVFRTDKTGVLVTVAVSQQSPLADEAALRSDAQDLARKLADKIEAALEG